MAGSVESDAANQDASCGSSQKAAGHLVICSHAGSHVAPEGVLSSGDGAQPAIAFPARSSMPARCPGECDARNGNGDDAGRRLGERRAVCLEPGEMTVTAGCGRMIAGSRREEVPRVRAGRDALGHPQALSPDTP